MPADGTAVEVAAQTVVDSVRVRVVAGMVYTPGVGQVVGFGVGTTGTGTTVEETTAVVVMGETEVVEVLGRAVVSGAGGK